jgi:hypothetical protein
MIEFTKEELEVLIKATGSSSPDVDKEIVQFKLYHKLIFRYNEVK